MVAILFLILVGISAYFVMSYNKKVEDQKRKIILLSRQNKNLKNDFESKILESKQQENVVIKFSTIECTKGVVNKETDLLIAPIDKSPMLGKICNGLSVEILDSGSIGGSIWYEIRFALSENINNKGWVHAEDVILAEDIIPPK